MAIFTLLEHAVVLICVTNSIASPPLSAEGGNAKTKYRRMLLPDAHSFLSNSYGSDFAWNTRGSPRNVKTSSWLPSNNIDVPVKTKPYGNIKRPLSQSSIVFKENVDTPFKFPVTNTPLRNRHEEMTNTWFEGDGIEQRMLLPEGKSIPEEMYGPDYIWDTKGWPRYVKTAPQPEFNYMKNSGNNKFYRDSPIIFEDNPPVSLNFPYNNLPQRSQQNYHKSQFQEEKPNSLPESDGIEQRMLLPEGQSIPKEMYGPDYIWDTKGWPRYVKTAPQPVLNYMENSGDNKFYKDSPIIFEDNPPVSLKFPYNNLPQRSQQNYHKSQFLEEKPISLPESDGIEQRMLLPEGYKMPEEMFGPNYIWDTKGWPRFVETTPEPKRKGVEIPFRSKPRGLYVG
ncbi:uncharacterized protein LOC110836983 [Zootermopsis nevadensis]|uniref:Uncharacterized protein n=1 Tax=Zootermopsis nevadensis TaxID=136037 RepID=A0A067QS37_ZOONE|nr:uncharacterized protein LOC110836983 [Zootermopsis nevadensis]KDR11521.1 hypothetical protein L798_14606 [Zootermopsis nevadensis]